MKTAPWILVAGLLVAPLFIAGCTTSEQNATGPIPKDAKITEAREEPINADTRYAAGQLAEASDEPDRAIIQYSEAIKMNPNHAAALFRLAVLYAKAEEYNKAVDTWKHYIAATHGSATGYGNLGFCYELMHLPDQAESSYKQGIEQDPKNQLCRVNYGLMLARSSRINDALDQFSAVLSPAEAHYNLGSVFEQLGKRAQAKLEYTRSLELDPTMSDAQQRLASLSE